MMLFRQALQGYQRHILTAIETNPLMRLVQMGADPDVRENKSLLR